MELLAKKKRAAAIAVSLFLQADENNGNESGVASCNWSKNSCNWSKMGMNRIANDKKFLFNQGRITGV
ncbi:hypothetical protein EC396_16740 [Lutibacter sp. HS1-25]|uniref:hypothetical protein n=1 Tax=Lutibacter sp. HS1-25 TaxID=2485000 RepID=UPI001012B9DC|nr:hypothetical protein [Lutibacter sp. HS1-25]RXP44806.1 hypothetical protein EC396_16740 [Lutibacter sp. HS1-25]